MQYIDGSTDKNERVRFESIIDFPYFLLHVLRVYIDANYIQLPDGEEPQRLLDDKKLISEFECVLQHETYGRRRVAVHKEHFAWNFVLCLLKCRFLFDKYIIKREYANESADGEWSLKQLEVSGRLYVSLTRHQRLCTGLQNCLSGYTAIRTGRNCGNLILWRSRLQRML